MNSGFFFLATWLVASTLGQFPRTFTDDAGRVITLRKQPQRIVTMLPSATETICSLSEEACARIILTDDFSDWPTRVKGLPKAGGFINPNAELIIAHKPDLVIASPGRLLAPLERVGLAVYVTDPQSFDDIFRTAHMYAALLGIPAQAESLVLRIQSEVSALERRVEKVTDRPRVYYEIDPTPYTVGPASFIGVLIHKAGGENIVPAALGSFPKINPELVVAQKPEVMVVTHREVAAISRRPGWAGLPAVKNHRICNITGEAANSLARPGPRVAQGLKLLIECFHPNLN